MTDSRLPTPDSRQSPYIVRFTPYQRFLHIVLFTTFLGLAATGLPLLFSNNVWAQALARAFGGIHTAGIAHRLFAFTMLFIFALHVAELGWRLVVRRERGILWGPTSLVPQPRDLFELVGHITWFVGLGPRPRFGRYAYWEKFDYWAVFWGMAIIGGSGLLLWFPEFFSGILPGWVYNVSLLVHGEEALLATGFIFTIHFFNSHVRPEKFPMDMVMFTGQVTEDELRHERPAEYDRLVAEGRLDRLRVPPEPSWVATGGRVLGALAVAIGLVLLVFILGGVLDG
jgi:cytochrome b subunit of formate dehydrogenase